MRKAIYLVVVLIVVIGIAGLAWRYRDDAIRSIERASLPSPLAYSPLPTEEPLLPTTQPTVQPKLATPAPTPAPAAATSVNLAVPFTPQAPHANWSLPYKEFCEEASVLMAALYIQNKTIPSPEFADAEMLKIMQFEEKTFGYYMDTNIADTAKILSDYYKISDTQIVENPTAAAMKQALSAGKVVIVPAAGRLLGNPYFQQPGPLYHMLVIKGFTADGRFIVNDPGTRRGADFLYSEATIMNAMHDWRTDEQIELGRKAVIIVG